jgi:hypothetical protein
VIAPGMAITFNTKKAIPKDLIGSLLADYKKPEDLNAKNGRQLLFAHLAKLRYQTLRQALQPIRTTLRG